jgi:hypothetical protein
MGHCLYPRSFTSCHTKTMVVTHVNTSFVFLHKKKMVCSSHDCLFCKQLQKNASLDCATSHLPFNFDDLKNVFVGHQSEGLADNGQWLTTVHFQKVLRRTSTAVLWHPACSLSYDSSDGVLTIVLTEYRRAPTYDLPHLQLFCFSWEISPESPKFTLAFRIYDCVRSRR